MQCYTELTPPTAVTHSLSLPFLSSSANNLIVVKTSLLQIFSLKSIITNQNVATQTTGSVNGSAPGSATIRPERIQTTKLILVAQYELAGTVTSIARVKILHSKSGGEALLVALRDAKLSLTEWDPERYSISTISIHYYEREDILQSPWEPDLSQIPTILTVDPGSRCAAFKFGARHLAILPFHQIGDDIAMDDYDRELDGAKLERQASRISNGEEAGNKTPYSASFVLSLLALDPILTHPIHLAFLHEYREPTFGILSSQKASSIALLDDRHDSLCYSVYNLDLEQRASTTLLSVNNLPYDLFHIIPLSRVIGGALLVGGNELIHVDQSGKTNGVAVNEETKHCTSFALADQSQLQLKLENCVLKQLGLENPELLLIEGDGSLLILSFKIDGRSVSGLHLRRVEPNEDLLLAGACCASSIGRGRMFIGSEIADSVILGWSRASDKPSRRRPRVDMDLAVEDDDLVDNIDEDIDVEEDEDDLYADDKPTDAIQATAFSHVPVTENDYKFRIHDSLINLGCMDDVTFGKPSSGETDPKGIRQSLVTTTGGGKSGALTIINTQILLTHALQYRIPNARMIWAVSAKKTQGVSLADADNLDKYLIAAIEEQDGTTMSRVYTINAGSIEEVQNTDFDPDVGAAIDVGVLTGGTRITLILPNEIRAYDADLGLAQILPLSEDDSDTQAKVVHASFADPYLLLVKDDDTITILAADEGGDLDEVKQGARLAEAKWKSGSLFDDSNDTLRLEFSDDDEEDASNVLLFLLSAAGGLSVYRLPSLVRSVYETAGLSFLPPFLSTEFSVRRSSAKDDVVEILVAELGDAVHKSPYLLLRTVDDDLVIYQPYQSPIEGTKDTNLRFLKLPNTRYAPPKDEDAMDEDEQQPSRAYLRVIQDINGYGAVWMAGSPSSFIVKSADCPPQILPLAGGEIKSLTPFHTENCKHGFAYLLEDSTIRTATLPPSTTYQTGVSTTRIPLGATCSALTYHAPQDAYVLALDHPTPFTLPDADSSTTNTNSTNQPPHRQPKSLPPTTTTSTLTLYDLPHRAILSTHALSPSEQITSLLCLPLDTTPPPTWQQLQQNEPSSHNLIPCIAVGTALIRGEDLPSTGAIYIFRIIDVVPDPSLPHTNRALKLIAHEETKGAVTSLSRVGTQGFLMAAQGQKILVRGLRDESLLPVAFLDVQIQTSVVRELEPGTGLFVVGDAGGKGVWLGGYMEEPYQLRVFAKSPYPIEVVTAAFLPEGRGLSIVALDADGNVHVLKYDPEDPSSLSGTRLIPTTSPFHTPHFPATATLLPATSNTTSTAPGHAPPSHHRHILLTSRTGTLALLTSLPPGSPQRTLSALQTHLMNTLPHALGLNVRGERGGSGDGYGGPNGVNARIGGAGMGMGMSGAGGAGAGGVLDGNLIRRWREGGSWRRWNGGVGMGEGEDGGSGRGRGVREMVRGATGGGRVGVLGGEKNEEGGGRGGEKGG